MSTSGAIGTFFVMLFISMFVAAVTSQGALKGPDAFVLRWTVISLAIVFSALVTWLRWTLSRPKSPPPLAATTLPAGGQIKPPGVSTEIADRFVLGTAQVLETARNRPRPTIADAVVAASRQAIVFRQHFPPHHDTSVRSFFGGAPIAPRGFRWPRPKENPQAPPFSFLMQIDCASVPASARLGLLPDHGVIYFFLDLEWKFPDAFFRVLYEERKENDWAVIQPPDDLPAAFGDKSTWLWEWPQSSGESPTLLPKWTFEPVAIELPPAVPDPDDEESDITPPWWPGDKVIAETLRQAQGETVFSEPFSIKDFADPGNTMRRPFANYPHDWRAVQICSGLILKRVGEKFRVPGTAALRELPQAERDALVARIREDAQTWFNRAASHPPFAAVPQTESDRFWAWLADKGWLVRFVIIEAVKLSIEASLVDSREAGARIPADVARRLHGRHALASESTHGLFATTPHRMLAPPSYVQGHQEDRARTHLLLLELSSNDGLGHHFGEGVLQFWITPADLKARRFDKVELSADAY